MDRNCYSCRQQLTPYEAADGQKALDEVHETFPEFEGWDHCKGSPSEFIQEDDTELKKVCRENDTEFFPDAIQICRPCVVAKWAEEKGIEDGSDHDKDIKEFFEFMKTLNQKRK